MASYLPLPPLVGRVLAFEPGTLTAPLPQHTADIIGNIMGPLGALLAIAMFTTSMDVGKKIIRAGEVGGYSYMPCFTQTCNCLLWVAYGISDYGGGKMLWPVLCNAVGVLLAGPALGIFIIYTSRPQRSSVLLRVLPVLLATLAFCIYVIASHSNAVAQFAGTLCMVINLIMYLQPCAGVHHAIKTRSTEYLPLNLGVSTVTCCVPWASYAAVISNRNIFVPNAVGLVFGSLQVLCYFYISRCLGSQSQPARELGSSLVSSEPAGAGSVTGTTTASTATSTQQKQSLVNAREDPAPSGAV